jgi:glycosyltransferase involved in cell wall biosynthesis
MAANRPVNAESPLISVLIPTYNAAAYLPVMCRSIQAQTYSQFEVVILDDGSTDETMSLLAPFAKDARFQIRSWKPNRGLNAALRNLLTLARGKYWVSPGADDVLLPEFLERRVALMEAHPEAVLVHGAAEMIDETGKNIPNPFAQLVWPARLDAKRALKAMLQHNFINQPSTVVRCDVTQNILPHYLSDWKFAPDWHLWILLLATGSDVLWDERPLLQYRVHGNSLSGKVSLAALRRAEVRLAPLCALKSATRYSQLAAAEWSQWGTTLYRLWLLRALKLRIEGALHKEWLDLAGEAYYGGRLRHRGLLAEFCRHGPGVALAAVRQRQAVRRQSFRVSGLAEIDDLVFKASSPPCCAPG